MPRCSNVRVRFDLNGDPNNIGGTFSTGAERHLLRRQRRRHDRLHPGHQVQPDQRRDDPGLLRHQRFRGVGVPESGRDDHHRRVRPALGDDRQQRKIDHPAPTSHVQPPVRGPGRRCVGPRQGERRHRSVDRHRAVLEGLLHAPDGAWVAEPRTPGGCANEDGNRNGVLESGPRTSTTAARSSRASRTSPISILGTGKTDSSGSAIVQIEYPQNVATWARVKILVVGDGRERYRRPGDMDRGPAGSGRGIHRSLVAAVRRQPLRHGLPARHPDVPPAIRAIDSPTGRRFPTRDRVPARIQTDIAAAPVVSLIGMPGCGKSTVGKELARRLRLPFVDCDRVIESAQRLHDRQPVRARRRGRIPGPRGGRRSPRSSTTGRR